MYKNLRWKIIATFAVAALAVAAIYPPSKRIELGLDLKGGIHLVLRVQTDDAIRLQTETSAEQLSAALTTAGLTATVKPTALTAFEVDGISSDNTQKFRDIADPQLQDSFDRSGGVGGGYVYTMKPNILIAQRELAVTQSIQTIERRVNELGVSEPVVAPYGNGGDQIVVQLPGVSDVERAKDIIGKTAVLELKMVQAGPAPDQATLLQPFNGQVPPDMEVLPEVVRGSTAAPGQPAAAQYYLVHKLAALTGNDLRTAREQPDNYNQPSVGFTLNNAGNAKFSALSSANVGKMMAIVLDGKIESAPTIDGPITTADAEITGHFTEEEANDLALVLRTGALPASLSYLEQQEVGPSLGADSIHAGIIASVLGLGLVTLFMLVYYRLAGINAVLSIVLNLLILLGFMAYLGAVMTLPGIAGFVLTIGMGVDSNVLIFERIREELALNKGVRQAVAAGFDRVFITILDTHICSLIAAAFLFQFGTGPIRGFATTLFFGLISNIFTSVFVSRTLFEFILSRKPAGAIRLSI